MYDLVIKIKIPIKKNSIGNINIITGCKTLKIYKCKKKSDKYLFLCGKHFFFFFFNHTPYYQDVI